MEGARGLSDEAEQARIASERAGLKAKLSWLETQLRGFKHWVHAAVLGSLLQALGMIVQAGILAFLLESLAMEHALPPGLPWHLAGFGAATLLRACGAWWRDYAGQRASHAVRQRIRLHLIDQVARLGPAWRRRETAGELTTLMIEQVDALDAYLARWLPQRRIAMLVPALIAAAVAPASWVVALILLATAPIIPLFMRLIGWAAQEAQNRQQRALRTMGARFLDLARGLRDLRLLDAAAAMRGSIDSDAGVFRQGTMKVLRVAFLSSAVLEFFTTLAIALSAIYLGYSLLEILGGAGADSGLGAALFALFLAPEFYAPLRELGANHHARTEALAASGRLMELEGLESPQVLGGAAAAPRVVQEIAFQAVRYGFGEGGPVLALDFTLPAGGSLALSGASASGKTTALRLLMGQLRPDSGSIRIGTGPQGNELEELEAASWREQIAWMGQHPRLLAASLADNLRIANAAAERGALEEALEFAGLAEWYRRLPEGLDTRLGEGERRLSGGQLRRLGLARLRLRSGWLMVLDEPSASLDPAAEEAMLEAIARLLPGRSLIVASHRPRTLALAAQTIRLEGSAGGSHGLA